MAKTSGVWGIDIGQCALKALRCRPHEKDDHRLVVEAFDYIEYPKILTQPEADRETLVRDALREFVSRNDVAGDSVAVAVPGQSGLARFIKLPPVESKKIPDIVKYEARQQIPFALEDVVWDYQPLVGSEDEGYALETEVGLFAMKRDQVARALKPLEESGVEVDIIQLAPLSIYNAICFDRLKLDGPYDPANPPPSTVVLSLGTDTTDLVITNGYRVWQRNIPIGGNHFTKALTKELKLTFAKAEHLKRNAMKAENPKVVFQAMRPVFSDLVAEIQRSIGFFTSNNRNAKLAKIVALGNPMKLPGLQRFLSQNLDQEVELIDQFKGLVGGTATASPHYKENQLTFGVAYGLCVQALGRAQIRTNLLPDEIVTKRLVRAKKPWVVAAVALVLVGLTINYARHYFAWTTANVEDSAMKPALAEADGWGSASQALIAKHSELTTQFDTITQTNNNLQSNVDGRLLWPELLKAVDAALPKDERPAAERKDSPQDVASRNELHVVRMDCEYVGDLGAWFNSSLVKGKFKPAERPAAPTAPAPAGETVEGSATTDSLTGQEATPTAGDPAAAAGEAGPAGPTGPGWVIEIEGYHFHNELPDTPPNQRNIGDESEDFVLNTFCRYLQLGSVELPDGPNGQLVAVPISALGIEYPVIISTGRTYDYQCYPIAADDSESQAAARGRLPLSMRGGMPSRENPAGIDGMGNLTQEQPEVWKLRRSDFTVQFCWRPQPRTARIEKLAKSGGAVSATAMAKETGAGPTTAQRPGS
jgi:type IV pilus assembly protein PilM